jgi:outer membrane protein assembly factor BamA
MFSHAVFSQDVFPKDMQALITLGNRFVYKDVDDELDPASGYKCMIDVSGTSGTSAFGRLLISGVRYTKVKDRVITVRAKVGKSILNKYWVNNFKGRDFPCRLVDYEPVSYVASPYKVGGSAGYNFSASLPVFANRWVNASVFWDAGCIWNSGLDPIGYGMMGDKISLNFTPGTSIVVRTPIPMLPPLTVSIGLPQIFGDGRHSSHANLLGIHVGFSLGGVM